MLQKDVAMLIAVIAVLCCLSCPIQVLAAKVLTADKLDETGEISLARLEASIYSLPHVEARIDVSKPDESVIVTPYCNPVLRFPWKVVDHSKGLNVTSELTVRIYSDEAFPAGEEPRWLEIRTVKKQVTNHGTRQDSTAKFERQSTIEIPVKLDYQKPVIRLKIVLNAAVRSSLHSSSKSKEQIIYIALPSKWKGIPHSHTALSNMLLYIYRTKQILLSWRKWLSSVMLANRSLLDSRQFGINDVLAVLKENHSIEKFSPDDKELEDTAFNLINETNRLKGKLAEKIDPVSSQLLGVNRIGFTATEAISRFGGKLNNELNNVVFFRNFLITVLNFNEKTELTERLSRSIHFCNESLKAISFLFSMNNSSDVAIFIKRTVKAVRQLCDEMAGIARLAGRLLGRDKNVWQGWTPIFETRLYKELYPDRAAGKKETVCKAVRELFRSFYYIMAANLYKTSVCYAAFNKSLQPFNLDAIPATITQPVNDEVIPKDLFVQSPVTGYSIKPGQIATYKITVRNLHNQPREVRFSEVRKLPSGWISMMTRDAITLQPGAEDTITYSVTAPYYAKQTMTSRSSVRVYFAEDVAHFHEIIFQTRCVTGDGIEAEAGRGPASLFVTAPDSERTITPGGLASYTFIIRHEGPGRKLVNFDIVSELPKNWIVDIDRKRLYLQPGVPTKVSVKVTAPLYLKRSETIELVAGAGYAEDFDSLEKIDLTKLVIHLKVDQPKPVINDGETKSYIIANHGQSTITATIFNDGNCDDTFDLFLSEATSGWKATLGETTVHLAASGEPVKVPICVNPSVTSRAGDYQKIQLTAISVSHPEIRTRNTMVISVADDTKLSVEPVKRIYRVDPGSAVDVALRVSNQADSPMKVGFRTSSTGPRSTWLNLNSPARSLAPGESRLITGHLRIPDNERTGQLIPFAVSAVNERGDEIGSVTFEAATCRRFAVSIVINKDKMARNAGIVTTKLLVTNLGTVRDTFAMLIRGGKRRWQAELAVNRLTLAAGETGETTLIVRIPPQMRKRKEISVDVQAKSISDSSASDFVTVNIEP